MRRTYTKNFSIGPFGCLMLVMVPLFGLLIFTPFACGIGGFGPANQYEAKVLTKHVNAAEKSSNYMITTDKGVFEIDNGVMLGVYNSDEIYGAIEVGKTYLFDVEGKKYTNFFSETYPYVISARKVD